MSTTAFDFTMTPERVAEIHRLAVAEAHSHVAAAVGLAHAPIAERAQIIGAQIAGVSVHTVLTDSDEVDRWRQALCHDATMLAVNELVRAMVPLEAEAAATEASFRAAADAS